MYLRSTPRRNKDGTEVRYLQLAHNVWDPQKRRSAVQVVYNFGREDAANREALQRLAASVTRFLDLDAALAASADGLEFTESRPLGGAWVLDALWARLGIGKEMRRLLERTPAGRERRAGAVRPGREPGAGPVVETGRGPLGQRGRAGHGPARHQRRCVLPGDGLADGDHRRPGAQGLRQPRHSAQPRGGRAVLRHHLHLLRDRRRRRPDRPGRSRHAAGQRERQHRRGRGTGAGRRSGPGGSPRTTATTCRRS